uniref:Uncharacterized protein MANES_02G200900 n=1 Tax=Rhizophora mucronata TaxID=61149 RepID=A0A2P2LY64_RHIMU
MIQKGSRICSNSCNPLCQGFQRYIQPNTDSLLHVFPINRPHNCTSTSRNNKLMH